MMTTKMTANKSHLLAYLKHTPGFEQQVRTFVDLPTNDILARVKDQDEQAYLTCISRFEQQGVRLEAAI